MAVVVLFRTDDEEREEKQQLVCEITSVADSTHWQREGTGAEEVGDGDEQGLILLFSEYQSSGERSRKSFTHKSLQFHRETRFANTLVLITQPLLGT